MKTVETIRRMAIVLVTALAAPLGAQSRISIPLPAGLPPAVLAFSNADAVAFFGNGEIHTITGLRNPPAASHQVLIPPGPLAIAGAWRKLNETTAVYLSTGGQLVLVRNLPDNPILINTGISATSLDPFAYWKEDRAVYVDPVLAEFRVLSHDAAGATLDVVASPVPLAPAPWPWRVSYRGHVAGLGPGADGTMGTADDQLVWLEGLSYGNFVHWADLPTWLQPEGLVFNQHGTMAVWNSTLWPLVNVTVIQVDSYGFPMAYVNLLVSTQAGWLPGPSACLVPCLIVRGIHGDSFLAGSWDDLGIDYCYRFIHQASTSPILGADYCDDAQAGTSVVLSEYETVGTSGYWCSMGYCGFAYKRYSATGYQGASVPMSGWTLPSRFWHPHPKSLTALYGDGTAVVVSDLLGTNVVQVLGGSGEWISGRELSPGRYASLFATGGIGAPPDELVILTAPGHAEMGASPSFPFELEIDPAIPLLSTPIHIKGLALDPGYAGPATLFLATDLGTPLALGMAPFAPGSVAHLDLQTVLFSVPLPMSGGFGEVVIDPSPLPPSLAGLHFYVQAVFLDPTISTWFLSDAHLVVIG